MFRFFALPSFSQFRASFNSVALSALDIFRYFFRFKSVAWNEIARSEDYFFSSGIGSEWAEEGGGISIQQPKLLASLLRVGEADIQVIKLLRAFALDAGFAISPRHI